MCADLRQGIISLLRSRPGSYSIPRNSFINRLKTDEIINISKKTFCFFLDNEVNGAMARVFICKLESNGALKSYQGDFFGVTK